jgi:hypothetical protein
MNVQNLLITLRKSNILLTFGYEKLSECIGLLTQETTEMNRQMKLTRSFTNSHLKKLDMFKTELKTFK